MAKDTGPQCKLCRREGEKLLLKGERCATPKCAMIKRAYPPGMHGEKGGRLTQYGKQLRAKQKVKRIYGILERQFRRYYSEASRHTGVTGDIILQILERRLDNVIYRLGLAVSRRQARQLVSHGIFDVNGKKINIASYSTKPGDVITVHANKQNNKYFANLKKTLSNKNLPEWLMLDVKKMEGKVNTLPTKADVDLSTDMQLIVELYSR
ncbi:30S ribosomal protein S4 [Patescibacteria group bacterium]